MNQRMVRGECSSRPYFFYEPPGGVMGGSIRTIFTLALALFISACGSEGDPYLGGKTPGDRNALFFYYSANEQTSNLIWEIDTKLPEDIRDSIGYTIHVGIEDIDGERFLLPHFSSEDPAIFDITEVGCGSIVCDRIECKPSRDDCAEERRFFAKLDIHQEGEARFMVHDDEGALIDAVTLRIGEPVFH